MNLTMTNILRTLIEKNSLQAYVSGKIFHVYEQEASTLLRCQYFLTWAINSIQSQSESY